MFRTFDPFDDFFGNRQATRPRAGGNWNLAYDVVRFDDRIEVSFDIPGVDPDSIELLVEKGELTLSAVRESSAEEGATIVTQGRPHGAFKRQLHLGDSLDVDNLEAAYDFGVLTLTIPLAAQAQPRKVAIGVGTQDN